MESGASNDNAKIKRRGDDETLNAVITCMLSAVCSRKAEQDMFEGTRVL